MGEDPWDRWISRARKVALPAFGIGLIVVLRESDPAPIWLVPVILALIFDPGAGLLDRKWRDLKETDE